jgi:hypothetical protein
MRRQERMRPGGYEDGWPSLSTQSVLPVLVLLLHIDHCGVLIVVRHVQGTNVSLGESDVRTPMDANHSRVPGGESCTWSIIGSIEILVESVRQCKKIPQFQRPLSFKDGNQGTERSGRLADISSGAWVLRTGTMTENFAPLVHRLLFQSFARYQGGSMPSCGRSYRN